MLRNCASAILHYAYKLQREWKREWNRLTALLQHILILLLRCFNLYQRIRPTYTHAGIIYFYRLSHTRTAHVWNEYVFIQRSTIGQSVFASFMMVAGCYVFFLRCMFCYNQDATIRPVLKHGPRSSTGLRVVEFLTKLVGKAKAILCEVIIFYTYCSTGWLWICIELSLCAYFYLTVKD